MATTRRQQLLDKARKAQSKQMLTPVKIYKPRGKGRTHMETPKRTGTMTKGDRTTGITASMLKLPNRRGPASRSRLRFRSRLGGR